MCQLREKFSPKRTKKLAGLAAVAAVLIVLKYEGNTKKRLYPDDLQQPQKFLPFLSPSVSLSPPGEFLILTTLLLYAGDEEGEAAAATTGTKS